MSVSSFTGSLLTSPFLRSDIIEGDKGNNVPRYPISTESCQQADGTRVIVAQVYQISFKGPRFQTLTYCDMIPIVSTVIGIGRILLGLAHTIVHLAKAVFDKSHRDVHLQEAALGAYNFTRGVIETVPGIGNAMIAIFDLFRIRQARIEWENALQSNLAPLQANINAGINMRPDQEQRGP